MNSAKIGFKMDQLIEIAGTIGRILHNIAMIIVCLGWSISCIGYVIYDGEGRHLEYFIFFSLIILVMKALDGWTYEK